MKRFLIILTLICLSVCPALAKKIEGQSLNDFSTIYPASDFSIRVLQDSPVKSLMPLRTNMVLEGKVIKIHSSRKCKRDSTFEFVPTSITYNGITEEIERPAVAIEVSGFQPTNSPKKIAWMATKTALGILFWGIPQEISFAQGAIQAPDGMRIEYGLRKLYGDSFISYIESGAELNVHKGDVLYMKLKKF